MICKLIIIPNSIINVTSEPVIVLSGRSNSLPPPVTIIHTCPLDISYAAIEWSNLLITDSGRLI